MSVIPDPVVTTGCLSDECRMPESVWSVHYQML